MEAIKMRNPQAEENYLRWLKRWRDACANLDKYDEKSLMFIFRNLESAWRAIGYCIGDRGEP